MIQTKSDDWKVSCEEPTRQVEAIHLGSLIAAQGYIFPISDHVLTMKDDGTFYRFQRLASKPSNAVGHHSTPSLIAYTEQYVEYDPFITPAEPSNPWISDDITLWDIEMSKEPSQQRVKRWGFSFDEILKDQVGRDQFLRFLESEFSSENLRFWLAVQDLKKQPLQDVAKRVEEIWQEFLAPGAPSAINLDSHSYEITSQNVKDGGRYTFEDAQEHIYKLMKSDSYARFLRSNAYQDLLLAKKKPESEQGRRTSLEKFTRSVEWNCKKSEQPPLQKVHSSGPSLSPAIGKVAGGQAPHGPDAVLLTIPTPGPGPSEHPGRRRSSSTDRASLRGDLVTVKEKEWTLTNNAAAFYAFSKQMDTEEQSDDSGLAVKCWHRAHEQGNQQQSHQHGTEHRAVLVKSMSRNYEFTFPIARTGEWKSSALGPLVCTQESRIGQPLQPTKPCLEWIQSADDEASSLKSVVGKTSTFLQMDADLCQDESEGNPAIGKGERSQGKRPLLVRARAGKRPKFPSPGPTPASCTSAAIPPGPVSPICTQPKVLLFTLAGKHLDFVFLAPRILKHKTHEPQRMQAFVPSKGNFNKKERVIWISLLHTGLNETTVI
ncbi:hypothetical protein A6R68_18349 [Neotoma lepida]|uniref:RGS domain-containing protein n=1 Tax=Neotoma lepida TaxID=56216 RepID=A0A1A6HNG3_NEOLE|nr:hypothetical protein A6R68_18349 [Neotoma lepida]